MAKEIERKFLVRTDGWKKAVTSQTHIRQAYIAAEPDRSCVSAPATTRRPS